MFGEWVGGGFGDGGEWERFSVGGIGGREVMERDGRLARTPFWTSLRNLPQSEVGSIHENICDYSDKERFARMAACMAMLAMRSMTMDQ